MSGEQKVLEGPVQVTPQGAGSGALHTVRLQSQVPLVVLQPLSLVHGPPSVALVEQTLPVPKESQIYVPPQLHAPPTATSETLQLPLQSC